MPRPRQRSARLNARGSRPRPFRRRCRSTQAASAAAAAAVLGGGGDDTCAGGGKRMAGGERGTVGMIWAIDAAERCVEAEPAFAVLLFSHDVACTVPARRRLRGFRRNRNPAAQALRLSISGTATVGAISSLAVTKSTAATWHRADSTATVAMRMCPLLRRDQAGSGAVGQRRRIARGQGAAPEVLSKAGFKVASFSSEVSGARCCRGRCRGSSHQMRRRNPRRRRRRACGAKRPRARPANRAKWPTAWPCPRSARPSPCGARLGDPGNPVSARASGSP